MIALLFVILTICVAALADCLEDGDLVGAFSFLMLGGVVGWVIWEAVI